MVSEAFFPTFVILCFHASKQPESHPSLMWCPHQGAKPGSWQSSAGSSTSQKHILHCSVTPHMLETDRERESIQTERTAEVTSCCLLLAARPRAAPTQQSPPPYLTVLSRAEVADKELVS